MARRDMEKLRRQMVLEQIAARGIADSLLLAAMRQVPREQFVGSAYRAFAYDDGPLPLPEQQTISQPYVVALMIDALKLTTGTRVLEIGTGSGYAAAVLSRIAAQVYTIERHASLVALARSHFQELGYDNIHLRAGDGTLGWPEEAPFDAIVVAASGPHVPPRLRAQLVVGGRLVIPVGKPGKIQQLICVTRRQEEQYEQERLSHVRFVPLIGQEGWPSD